MGISQELRVDKDRYNDALDAATFLTKYFLKTGRYKADESWGPEGILYLAESSYALMDAYCISKQDHYLQAVKAILEELKRIQKPNGGWAIDLSESGVGFKVTDEERRDSAEKVDPPTTSAMLRTIADYYRISGDNSYREMGDRAFDYLKEMWDPEVGTFVEKTHRKLLDLRSNPNAYHLFFLIGVSAWRVNAPDVIDEMYPSLLDFVKRTYEAFDSETMPLIYALHTAILLEHCSKEYITNTIQPKIVQHLVNNDIFRTKDNPGGYGHRDGSRGIVTDEAHMRSSAGIAIALKQYDLITETKTFTKTSFYQDLSGWIDQMKVGDFYYEFELLPERIKKGYGSPGQYLPIWWILGKV